MVSRLPFFMKCGPEWTEWMEWTGWTEELPFVRAGVWALLAAPSSDVYGPLAVNMWPSPPRVLTDRVLTGALGRGMDECMRCPTPCPLPA